MCLVLCFLEVTMYISYQPGTSSDWTVFETFHQMLGSCFRMKCINLRESRSLIYDSCVWFKWVTILFIFIMQHIYSSLVDNSIQSYINFALDSLIICYCQIGILFLFMIGFNPYNFMRSCTVPRRMVIFPFFYTLVIG